MTSKDKRDHSPFVCHLVRSELLAIPLLRAASSSAQVHGHENKTKEHRSAQNLSGGRRSDRQTQIDEAFARIVGADNVSEPALVRQRVLFEPCEVPMALILLNPAGYNEPDGGGDP